MKRYLSLFLVLLLVLSPMSGLNFRADALEIITISEINLPEIPTLGEGSSTELSWAVAPAGEHYTVNNSLSRWLTPSSPTNMRQYSESSFVTGAYALELILEPEEGYAFAEEVTINTPGYASAYRLSDGSLRLSAPRALDIRELIPEVTITGFPELVAGESYDCSTIACSTEGVTLTAKAYTAGSSWGTTGTFLPNTNYSFELSLEFPLDHKISEETVITINGKTIEDRTIQCFWGEGTVALNSLKVPSLVIDEIQLLNLPEVEVGESTDLSGIQVPADAPYYIDFDNPYTRVLKIENGVGESYYKDTYEEGTFFYDLTVRPKEGYSFADDVTVNSEGESFNAGSIAENVLLLTSSQYTLTAKKINTVSINFTEPAQGETPDFDPQLPENAPYALAYFAWLVDDEEMRVSDTYQTGVYNAFAVLQPEAGYVFSQDLTLKINGTDVTGWEIRGNDLLLTKAYGLDVNVIDTVEVSYTKPEANTTAPEVTLKNSELYENFTLRFYDYKDAEYLMPDEQFQLGSQYAIDVSLIPMEGYVMAPHITFIVNDETCTCYSEIEPDRLFAYHDFIIERVIDTVEISFDEPEVGKTAPKITLQNPEQYDEIDFAFYDYNFVNGYMGESDTFQSGGEYSLDINLTTPDYCTFAEDITLVINGKSYTKDDGGIFMSSNNNEHNFYAEYFMDTCVEIDTVALSFDEPKAGREVPEVSFKNPELLDDTYVRWYSADTDGEVYFFEKGGEYALYLDLYAVEGYKFAEDVTIIINGETVDLKPEHAGIDNIFFNYYFDVVEHRTVISEVDFPAWPSFKVGDPIPEAVVPADGDEPFFMASIVLVYDPLQNSADYPDGFFPASGVFEEGKVYRMEHVALAHEDYRFDTDTTKVTQNKQSVTPQIFNSREVSLKKYYNFSEQTVLETLDLLLTEPALGKAPSDVTLADGVPCSLEDVEWCSTPDPINAMMNPVTDSFPAGYPVLFVTIQAGEDVLLANNMKFTVNGKPVTATVFDEGSTQQSLYIVFDELVPTIIPAVDFRAWPELKPGDSFDYNSYQLIPAPDRPYVIMAQLVDSKGTPMEADDTLRTGETYTLMFVAMTADSTFAFNDSTKVTQDGEEATGRVPLGGFGMTPETQKRIIALVKYYNFNEDVTVLERVDLNVDQPKIGEEPGSVTLPTDSPLKLKDATWGNSRSGNMSDARDKNGAWDAGDYPIIAAQVTVPENMILSPGAKVYVNGELQENPVILTRQDTVVIGVVMDQLVVEEPGGDDPDGPGGNEGGGTGGIPEDPTNPTNPSNPTNPTNPTNPSNPGSPSTGDMSNISVYVIVMLVSLCGVCCLLLVARKRTKA